MKYCSPSRLKRYRALRKPRCNDGVGCTKCWTKWTMVQRLGLRVVGAI